MLDRFRRIDTPSSPEALSSSQPEALERWIYAEPRPKGVFANFSVSEQDRIYVPSTPEEQEQYNRQHEIYCVALMTMKWAPAQFASIALSAKSERYGVPMTVAVDFERMDSMNQKMLRNLLGIAAFTALMIANDAKRQVSTPIVFRRQERKHQRKFLAQELRQKQLNSQHNELEID